MRVPQRGWPIAAAALFLLLAVMPVQSAGAQEEEAFQLTHRDAISKPLNETADDQKFRELRRGVYWQTTFGQMNTRYIRFRFDNIKSPSGAAYRVRILRLPLEEEVASYPGAEFAQQDSFMTGLLPSGELRIELLADSVPTGLSFRLESALWQALPTEALVHSPLVRIIYAVTYPENSPLREQARSVAMLHIGPLETTCTAVLIDEQTLATNNHCMKYSLAYQQTKQAQTPACHDIVAEFDFLAPTQRGTQAKCKSVSTDETLDLALLTFDRQAIEMAPGKARQPVKMRPLGEGMPTAVRLIHHPLGLPLVIDDQCALRKVEQPDLLHDCSAVNGSSGSPLFDEQLRWIGLHYKGPYPRTWTVEKIFEHIQKNGPSYNRAKASAVIADFMKK